MSSNGMEGLAGLSPTERGWVEQAAALRVIWDNPMFGGMLQQVSQEILQDTAQTSDEDAQGRERLYWQGRGIQRLMEAFAQRIREGDAVRERMERAKMQPIDRHEQEEAIID